MAYITALGELLIDFTPAGLSQNNNRLFEQNPGGAPANVLTAVVKQGGKGALISCVGNDAFGHELFETISELGIGTQGIQFTDEAATTLAFVTLSESGDRSFSFFRNPGADQKIKKENLNTRQIDSCQIFHFGSLSLSDEPSRSAALFAADYAQKEGKIVSYDPNWRAPLWKSQQAGIEGMKLGLKYANILKLSSEELNLLSDTNDLEAGTDFLKRQYPSIMLIVVTLGSKGCFYRFDKLTGTLPTYNTKVVDTTGAGDAFWGAFLVKIADNAECLYNKNQMELEQYLDWANASGSLCAEGRGAIPSIPTSEKIIHLQNSTKR